MLQLSDVEMLDASATTAEILEFLRGTVYSRIPVYHETIDNIVGLIHEKDFYAALLSIGAVPAGISTVCRGDA